MQSVNHSVVWWCAAMPIRWGTLGKKGVQGGSALSTDTLGVIYAAETQLDPAFKFQSTLEKILATPAISLEHLLQVHIQRALKEEDAACVMHTPMGPESPAMY